MRTSPAFLRRRSLGKIGIVFQDPDNRMAATVVEDEIALSPGNMCLPPKAIRERVVGNAEAVSDRSSAYAQSSVSFRRGKAACRHRLCFAADPPVIVMDEPVSHLDEEGREKIRRLIRELKSMGRTILMAEHDFFHLDMADRILFLEDGVIGKEGSPAEMIPFLEAYLTEDAGENGRGETGEQQGNGVFP